jgi:hypothetical protein
VLQLQAKQLVIGTQHQQAQLLGQAQGDPSSRRRRRVAAEQV